MSDRLMTVNRKQSALEAPSTFLIGTNPQYAWVLGYNQALADVARLTADEETD